MTLLRVVIGFIYGLMYVPVLLLFLVIAPMVTEANGVIRVCINICSQEKRRSGERQVHCVVTK